MFESFLFESLKRHQLSKYVSCNFLGNINPCSSFRRITAKHLHLFASVLPNMVETGSLILVISVLHISGFKRYMSFPGFHHAKCDPIPHRAPGVLNRLMGRNWQIAGEFGVDSRVEIEDFQLNNGTTANFPLSFFACEGLIEIIYLFGALWPLICCIGEFAIMYLYRRHFKLEGGKIVPN